MLGSYEGAMVDAAAECTGGALPGESMTCGRPRPCPDHDIPPGERLVASVQRSYEAHRERRTDAARAAHCGRLLARIMTVSHQGGTTDRDRLRAVWQVLADAGYHYGQTDDDGLLVPPPHDDGCAMCQGGEHR